MIKGGIPKAAGTRGGGPPIFRKGESNANIPNEERESWGEKKRGEGGDKYEVEKTPHTTEKTDLSWHKEDKRGGKLERRMALRKKNNPV